MNGFYNVNGFRFVTLQKISIGADHLIFEGGRFAYQNIRTVYSYLYVTLVSKDQFRRRTFHELNLSKLNKSTPVDSDVEFEPKQIEMSAVLGPSVKKV